MANHVSLGRKSTSTRLRLRAPTSMSRRRAARTLPWLKGHGSPMNTLKSMLSLTAISSRLAKVMNALTRSKAHTNPSQFLALNSHSKVEPIRPLRLLWGHQLSGFMADRLKRLAFNSVEIIMRKNYFRTWGHIHEKGPSLKSR